ncbi:hypothetical protein RUND412_004356 [Rhizina undulata]
MSASSTISTDPLVLLLIEMNEGVDISDQYDWPKILKDVLDRGISSIYLNKKRVSTGRKFRRLPTVLNQKCPGKFLIGRPSFNKETLIPHPAPLRIAVDGITRTHTFMLESSKNLRPLLANLTFILKMEIITPRNLLQSQKRLMGFYQKSHNSMWNINQPPGLHNS